MRKVLLTILAIAIGSVIGFSFGSKPWTVQGQGTPASIAAVSGQVGGQDPFGPYDVVKDWPANISTLPGNEAWTDGAGQGLYAVHPDRVFMLFRGDLPNIKRPAAKLLTDFGPSLVFPIGRLPWRDATVSALPGSGGTGQEPEDGPKNWMEGKGVVGVDAKWEHCLTIVDSKGKIIETFPQYDHLFKRPHFVTINPYDAEKHIWIVDDHMHAIYIFTHDMKTLVKTMGRPTVKGADGTHFNRPTFLSWLPDSTLYVADGYNGTRVAKFDKTGKFLMDWGMRLECI